MEETFNVLVRAVDADTGLKIIEKYTSRKERWVLGDVKNVSITQSDPQYMDKYDRRKYDAASHSPAREEDGGNAEELHFRRKRTFGRCGSYRATRGIISGRRLAL
ncbi:hypothetical protein FIBSPDRAFT_862170, partial [Athelia psychrophila]